MGFSQWFSARPCASIDQRLCAQEYEIVIRASRLTLCRASVPKGKWKPKAFKAVLKKNNVLHSTVFRTPMRVY